LPSPSGNIASDGTYLYFAQGNNLLRNTPGTGFFLGMAQLPVAYDPADILLETVRVLGTVPADPGFTEYTDFNANGIPDRKMRFPRTAFVMALPETDSADVVVTGEVRDRTVFVARDRIRIKRPRIAAPNGGEILAAGSLFPVVWEKPAGMEDLTSTLAYWSASAQAWVPIADGLTGTTFAWQMPDEPSETCRLRVATAAACDRSWTGPSPRAATR
jgi:hypothetical protein